MIRESFPENDQEGFSTDIFKENYFCKQLKEIVYNNMNDTWWEFCIKILLSVGLTKAVEFVISKFKNIRKSIKANLNFIAAVLVFSLSLFSLPFGLDRLTPLLFIPIYGVGFLASCFFGLQYYRRITTEKDLLNFIARTGKEIRRIAAAPDQDIAANESKQRLYASIRVLRSAIHEIELEFTRNFRRGKFGGASGSTAENDLERFKKFETELGDIYNKAITHIHKTIFNSGEGNYAVYTDSGIILRPVGEPRYRWLLDPVDGVYHFHNQIPFYTTCAALQEKRGNEWETMLGVIYIPITREFFYAINDGNDKSAYLNDWTQKLNIRNQSTQNEDMLFHMEFPNLHSVPDDYNRACEFLKAVLCKARRTRGLGLGSWGMAYTAKGAFHAYMTISGGTQIYDIIAGKLLVECAGGKVILESCSQGNNIPNPLPDRPCPVKVFAANENTLKMLREDLAILFNPETLA